MLVPNGCGILKRSAGLASIENLTEYLAAGKSQVPPTKEDSLDAGNNPAATYTFLLQQCTSLPEVKRLHTRITEDGYQHVTFLANFLIQMYGKCGSLEDATNTFVKMPQRNVFSWNIMIVACTDNGRLQDAKNTFTKMPERNAVGWTTMITAYAKYGHLVDARSLFDLMPERTSITWAAMISAYNQNGYGREALYIFRLMDMEGGKPNHLTFVLVLDACTSIRALADGKELHRRILCSNDIEIKDRLANALANLYGKCGDLDSARNIFDEMSDRSSVSWNLMIGAYCQRDRNEAIKMFREMQQHGVTPDKVTFLTILDACSTRSYGKIIQQCVMESVIQVDVVLGTSIITMFGKCGSLLEAKNMFDAMEDKNVVTWTAMITASGQNEDAKMALEILRRMLLDGTKPNEITIVSIFDACAVPSALNEGASIHASTIYTGFHDIIKVGNSVVSMYGKCGSLQEARKAFDGMPMRDVVSWTAMIAAYAHSEKANEALSLFRRMDLEGLHAVEYTFVSLLEACARLTAMREGILIHAAVDDCGYSSDLALGNALVNMYGKCGSLNDAEIIFHKMLQRNVVTWTTMITLYVQAGMFEKAVATFACMDLESLSEPNEITLLNTINAAAGLGNAVSAKIIHEIAAQSKSYKDMAMQNALLDMFAKCGSMGGARNFFNSMLQHDVVACNTMLAAYAHNGYRLETIELFQQMQLEGVQPSEITFISVLAACNHIGLVDDGIWRFLTMINDYGVVPTIDHYVCVVVLLSRGGRMKDAEELIECMPFEPDIMTWSTLLGACSVHGDVKRGERCTERLLLLNPNKVSSAYTLMSNIYAEHMHPKK